MGKCEKQKTLLNGNIEQLNSQQIPQTTWYKDDKYMRTQCSATRAGNIVTISYNSDWNEGTPAGNLGKLFELSERYFPASQILFVTLPYISTCIQISINVDGEVYAYNYGNALTRLETGRFTCSYVAKN